MFKIRKYDIIIHVGAWLIIILPTIFLMFDVREDISNDRFIIHVFNTIFTIINFYLFFLVFIPKLFDTNKVFLFIIITILFLILYPLLQFEFFSYLNDHSNIHWKRLKHKGYFLSQAYSTTLLFSGLAFLARYTIKWITEKQKQAELINQNQSSELALLRSQINPHFLFNTLNNIYSLVMKKSDKAPEAMMKLSEIMRYTLYDTNTDEVFLENEIKYLYSYIELLQLRIKTKNFIEFQIDGNSADKKIAPMILVPFVENAFKHCDKKAKSPGISIHLEITNHEVIYKVINSKKVDEQNTINESGGIGFQNIKRRLQLLYPQKHELEITESDNTYNVILKLKL